MLVISQARLVMPMRELARDAGNVLIYRATMGGSQNFLGALAQHGYQLFRPDPQGRLVPITDPGFGADVFARPAVKEATR